MNKKDFAAYKQNIRMAIRAVLAEAERGRLDEAAFPAYSNHNPLINWLFWQRLRKAMRYLEREAPYEKVLDFGCGSGVLLPFLAGLSNEVIAADLDMEPLRRMRVQMTFPQNISEFDLSIQSLAALPEGSLDVITALDVLEHVKDLPGTLDALLRLLKPGGKLVISGPTENAFYKLGRAVAGREYSGHYHERGIAEIRQALAQRAKIEPIGKMYPPIVLFDVFAGRV